MQYYCLSMPPVLIMTDIVSVSSAVIEIILYNSIAQS